MPGRSLQALAGTPLGKHVYVVLLSLTEQKVTVMGYFIVHCKMRVIRKVGLPGSSFSIEKIICN